MDRYILLKIFKNFAHASNGNMGDYYESYKKYYLKCATGTPKEALENCILEFQKFILQFLPLIVVLAITVAGFLYILFSRQPEKLKIPIKVITYTLIGTAIVLGANIILSIIRYIFLY